MSKLFAICWLTLFANLVFAQDDCLVYSWAIAKKANPDTIYGISFKKMKLTQLPPELANYKHLKQLDVSHNKLDSLPYYLVACNQLEILNISRNKFNRFPPVICSLIMIKRLSFNRNAIPEIPSCISALKQLTYIDFWDNPIPVFPEEFTELKNLKTVHAEGILYGPIFQDTWKYKLPNTNIFFDPPCDCKE